MTESHDTHYPDSLPKETAALIHVEQLWGLDYSPSEVREELAAMAYTEVTKTIEAGELAPEVTELGGAAEIYQAVVAEEITLTDDIDAQVAKMVDKAIEELVEAEREAGVEEDALPVDANTPAENEHVMVPLMNVRMLQYALTKLGIEISDAYIAARTEQYKLRS